MPKWLMTVFAAGIIAIAGNGVTTWAKANSNTEQVERHDKRIENLEKKFAEINLNIGKLQQSVEDMKGQQNQNAAALDRLLNLEMSRRTEK